jgi:hypothetical protein
MGIFKLCLYWYSHVTELTVWHMVLIDIFVITLHGATNSRGEYLRWWKVFAIQRCTVLYYHFKTGFKRIGADGREN